MPDSGLSSLPPLRAVVERHGIMARRSLGQNFLFDLNLTDRIAREAGDLSQHHIIEIGPGPGGLTRALLLRGAKHVTAIEKDALCLPALEELREAAGGRLTLVRQDALTFNYARLDAPRKIIANLPYNVGTALLLQWLDIVARQGASAFAGLTLMFQKEVAERIAAPPGSKQYGRLSVMAQWLCEVRDGFDIPPEAFTPRPKIISRVITLTPRPQPLFAAEKAALEKVVAAAFGQRRKMLRSALKTLGVDTAQLLSDAGIVPEARAETLSIEAFCRLAMAYSAAIKSASFG